MALLTLRFRAGPLNCDAGLKLGKRWQHLSNELHCGGCWPIKAPAQSSSVHNCAWSELRKGKRHWSSSHPAFSQLPRELISTFLGRFVPFSSKSGKVHRHASNKVTGIRASSEFWYEEEVEFDVNEIVRPKRIVLMRCAEHNREGLDGRDAPEPAQGSTLTQRGREQAKRGRAACERFNFQAAFCSLEAAVEETADIMWEKRGGPPYFRKVRPRATLQGLGGLSETSATSSGGAELAAPDWDTSAEGRLLTEAREFLTEVCTINWSTELTEGLGGGYLDPAKDREDILVVSHASSLAALVAVALQSVETARALVFDPGSLTVLEYSGSGKSTQTAEVDTIGLTNTSTQYEHRLPGTFNLCSLDLEPSE